MPKPKITSVIWTERALQNAVDIKKYLLTEFSSKEFNNFLAILHAFEIAISAFPELYPGSFIKPGIRRAVLSKALSVFYRIHKSQIEVLAVLDNRCDLSQALN